MAILHLRVIKNHNITNSRISNSNNNNSNNHNNNNNCNNHNRILRWLHFGLLLIAFHCLQSVSAVDLGKLKILFYYMDLRIVVILGLGWHKNVVFSWVISCQIKQQHDESQRGIDNKMISQP
jgi:hypothetical protein